jgi:hypothetical protein
LLDEVLINASHRLQAMSRGRYTLQRALGQLDRRLADALRRAYNASQKFDYDSDLNIEATDGFVDLYDFARHASRLLTNTLLRQTAGEIMSKKVR